LFKRKIFNTIERGNAYKRKITIYADNEESGRERHHIERENIMMCELYGEIN